jgi:hypothetical protein
MAALVIASSASAGALSFGPPVFGVDDLPRSPVVADFDGDSVSDVAVAHSSSVSVLRGRGDGSFEAMDSFATPATTRALAAGDADGDTVVDLVVVADSGVSVVLGAGDGTFEAPAPLAVQGAPRSVAIAHVDGDTLPDIVVGSTTTVFAPAFEQLTHVTLLRGGGDGSFQALEVGSARGNLLSMALGDLDHDTVPDLVLASYYRTPEPTLQEVGEVTVLLGNGDGSFEPLVPRSESRTIWSIALGNLDGDPFPDLVLASSESSLGGNRDVSVWLGTGDGSFEDAGLLGVGGTPRSVAVADLDGDTRLDLIAEHYLPRDVSVLLGNGDGGFAGATSIGMDVTDSTVADLDGDHVLDLVAVNDGTDHVWGVLGNGDGSFQTAPIFAPGDGPEFLAAGDLDGDDVVDLVSTNALGNDLGLLLGRGDGTFEAPVSLAPGTSPLFVAIADLDGDTAPDLVSASADAVSVLLGNGDGSFQGASPVPVSSHTTGLAVADLNDDDIPDLAVSSIYTTVFPYASGRLNVLLGNGDGSFLPLAPQVVGPTSAIAVADLDGDTIADLVVAAPDSVVQLGDLSVLLGNGDGTFQPGVFLGLGRGFLSVALEDLDGDGVTDVAATRILGEFAVLLGNGDGSFQAPVFDRSSSDLDFFALGDLDCDTIPDIVAVDADDDRLSVLLGRGDGSFEAPVTFAAFGAPVAVAVSKLDGDARPDVATANYSIDAIQVFINAPEPPRMAVTAAALAILAWLRARRRTPDGD